MSQSLANMIAENNTHFFEGVEKLMEVWFTRKDGMTSNCDLRKIPRSQLEAVMQIVKCEIISTTSTEEIDAYLLSESSMFISARRFILKTCGTTTPLCCLPVLISLVQEYAGYDHVQDLYYSRKNFKRPELQVSPHRTFEEEASILDQFFPGGRAYCMGSVNRADCWYLYTVSPGRPRYRPNAARHNLPHNRIGKIHREPDQTLEVLMMDLDPEKMKWFYKNICPTAAEATKKSGIDRLIPEMMIDDYQFEPCGYSMNGLMRSVPSSRKGYGGYMTIHITPEPEFSYVSFETNVPQKSYKDLIARVVATFGPKQFVLTFFTSVESGASIGIEDDSCSVPQYSDYDVDDIQICRLQGYDLTYALYNRFPS
ncbi:S-adenosylmethionine decarboxylase proenzyme-like isoform X1 [Homarus americanus]|uniref:S-adenosylmethionine decarboxylase proenzyme-like isoform X1 n=1 Tax=Homarus americanus TaxID=6706 RepID=UPI001C494A21|nr:S-adenosylmethionine decarboxylase proenzyme-like isoform X1 [Homarus americanus]